MPEASSDVEREGDAGSEPRGLGIDVEDAEVISKRDHADAAVRLVAERGDDAHAHRAWDACRASEDEDDVREVAFEFLFENFVKEQLNQEGEAPAAGAVAPTGSALKPAHTMMLSVWAKNIVFFVDALVEAARSCHQAVTHGTVALMSLDTEVLGQPSVTALHWLHVDDVTCGNDGRVTGLIGRQTSLDDQSRLEYARTDTRQDFSARLASGDCPILLPCIGVKMVRSKGAQRPAMPPWSLRLRAWHDNKLDDDTALGAFDRDPCILCGK